MGWEVDGLGWTGGGPCDGSKRAVDKARFDGRILGVESMFAPGSAPGPEMPIV